jgi:hypothetical protein
MTKNYASKRSYALLIFIFLVFFGPLILKVVKGEFYSSQIGILAFLFIAFSLVLHLFIKTNYRIKNRQLIIKSGFYTYPPIQIDEIKEIVKTNSILSAPAPSFDRIEIKYGKYDSIIISPQNKLDFAKDLSILNPSIKMDWTNQ